MPESAQWCEDHCFTRVVGGPNGGVDGGRVHLKECPLYKPAPEKPRQTYKLVNIGPWERQKLYESVDFHFEGCGPRCFPQVGIGVIHQDGCQYFGGEYGFVVSRNRWDRCEAHRCFTSPHGGTTHKLTCDWDSSRGSEERDMGFSRGSNAILAAVVMDLQKRLCDVLCHGHVKHMPGCEFFKDDDGSRSAGAP